jgi:predicted membrane chloride channel (bestrophin family)
VPELPAAQDNAGNLFKQLGSNIYTESLEQLKREGKVAPSTYLYDPNQPLKHLVAFSGTVLKMCFTSAFFWFIMFINVLMSILYYTVCGNHENFDTFFETGKWPYISSYVYNILGGLVSFMLVFHASDCYARFFQQYNTVRAIEVNINSVLNLLRTHMPDDAFEGAGDLRTTVAKWMVAQVYLGFGWLPTYRENNVDEWAWERVNEYGLIGSHEKDHLMALPVGEYPITEITTSCTQLLWKFARAGKLDEGVAGDIGTQISGIENNFLSLYATTEQPVPFAMYHYISFINNTWLILIAYQYIFYSYYWGIISFFLNAVAFQGLRELSNNLAEPFGNDETDIPVFDFVVKWHTRVDNFIHLPVRLGCALSAKHA